MVHRLGGRRGTEAASLLIDLLGGDAGVVVIDGRAVVEAQLQQLRDVHQGDRNEDQHEAYRARDVQRSHDVRAVIQLTESGFRAAWEWLPAPMVAIVLDTGRISASREIGPDRWRHRTTGELLGGWDFYGRLNQAIVEAVGAVPPSAQVEGEA